MLAVLLIIMAGVRHYVVWLQIELCDMIWVMFAFIWLSLCVLIQN